MHCSGILYLAFASVTLGQSSRRLVQLFNDADFKGGNMVVFQDFAVDCVNLDAKFRDKVRSIKLFTLASCQLFIKEKFEELKLATSKSHRSLPGPSEVGTIRCVVALNMASLSQD
ncbi:hypothetical protein PT974_01659 [Cladobotryum mycophilum]|uniref:Uncharacterized protein n=1 Tax=Cladobotryum mycophilum TaxID=491253 RepID=A0ABR0T4A8_9HYPO